MKIDRIIVGQLRTNCYILSSDAEMAVIDPGSNSRKIISELADLNLGLKYVIITHYHDDHIAGAKEVKKAMGGEIIVHESEKDYLDFLPDRWLHNSEVIAVGNDKLKAINTPGHTPGSICLLGNGFVFTGDTLFKDGYGRTDLAGGSRDNMNKSLEFLRTIIKPSMIVYPGHGEIFIA